MQHHGRIAQPSEGEQVPGVPLPCGGVLLVLPEELEVFDRGHMFAGAGKDLGPDAAV